MASGVGVSGDVVEMFNKLKTSKSYKYITFKLSDDQTKIEVDPEGAKAIADWNTETDDKDVHEEGINKGKHSWAKFCEILPPKLCRWYVIDFQYNVKDSGVASGFRDGQKIVLVCWAPDDAKIKEKMTFASSKDALKKQLTGIGADLQLNDKGDADDFESVREKVNLKK